MAKWNRGGRPSIRIAGDSLVTTPRSLPPETALVAGLDDTEILDREPGKFCFARWKNVVMQAWAAQVDAAAIERLRPTLTRVGSFGLRSNVTVVAEGLPPPTAEAIAGFVDLMNSGAKELQCVAIVVHGSGFASSALRSAVTRIRLATTRAAEMAVMTSVEELGPWLPPRHMTRTGVTLDPVQLCDFVSEVARRAASTAPAPSMLTRP